MRGGGGVGLAPQGCGGAQKAGQASALHPGLVAVLPRSRAPAWAIVTMPINYEDLRTWRKRVRGAAGCAPGL